MKAVVITDDRALEVQELDEPEPGEGQVRVKVEACGICGSDLHMLPSPAMPAGTVMGHEFAGEIDALGPGVEGFAEGDRVCVYPFKPIDHHDLEVAMNTGLGMGGGHGAYAEKVVASAEMLWRLPDGVELEQGALVEPLAVALHGVDIGGVEAGDACAVIGAGPIGIMTAVALRARGVENVVVIEKNEHRAARMGELGFDVGRSRRRARGRVGAARRPAAGGVRVRRGTPPRPIWRSSSWPQAAVWCFWACWRSRCRSRSCC